MVDGIIISKGVLEALDYFSKQLSDAARKMHLDVYEIDFKNESTYIGPGLDEFVKTHRCIAVFFNQIGLLLIDDFGKNYWDAKQIPVYSMQVDHPRNFADAMTEPIEMLRVLGIDRKHETFVNRFFPKVKHHFFLPNGGASEVVDFKPLAEREIEVLYVGGCQSPVESFPILDFFEDNGNDFYGKVLSMLLQNPSFTTEEAMEKYFVDRGLQISDEDLLKLFTAVSIYIETYVRREYKQLMLQTLDKRGITVDIYGGGGWENVNYVYGPNIRFHSKITSAECNEKIANAKITLNCMPWYKDGSSERPFNTMLNGSLCMIDPSDYLLERFTDKKEICFYDIQRPDELADQIEYYLNHLGEAQEIANRGYGVVMESDTWEERLKEIICLEEGID